MTKKDYIVIASAIWRSGYIEDKNAIRQKAKEDMRRLITLNLISELKKDNPKFDAEKFKEACDIIN